MIPLIIVLLLIIVIRLFFIAYTQLKIYRGGNTEKSDAEKSNTEKSDVEKSNTEKSVTEKSDAGVSIDSEYKNWILSRKLIDIVDKEEPLQHFIIDMYLTGEPVLFKKLEIEHPVYQKLSANLNLAGIDDVSNVVKKIHNAISEYSPTPEPDESAKIEGEDIVYRDFRYPISKFRTFNPKEVIRMLLRYSSIYHKLELLPEKFYKYLSDKVTLEAFASPIDHQFPRYCSLFPEIDKPFGSIGNFFDVSIGENCLVYPPQIESLVRGVYKKCERIEATVYFITKFNIRCDKQILILADSYGGTHDIYINILSKDDIDLSEVRKNFEI